MREHVAHTAIGPARQIFQVLSDLAFQSLDLQWQDNAEFADQATNAVVERGAFFDKALASAVQAKNRLLVFILDRHKAHVRSGDGFANRGGIGRIILAALAGKSVRRDELGGNQANGMAML